MSRSAKKIPIIIIIVCIALILVSVYLEQNKKARILGSIESIGPSVSLIDE